MARTQAVIIYSFAQGVRRRLILPSDDSQIPQHTTNLRPGERALVISLSDYRTRGPDATLAMYLGRKPMTDRCAVISAAGIVVHVVHGDPSIDRHPSGRLHRANNLAVKGKLAQGLSLLP